MLDRILPKLKAGGHRVLIFSQMTKRQFAILTVCLCLHKISCPFFL